MCNLERHCRKDFSSKGGQIELRSGQNKYKGIVPGGKSQESMQGEDFTQLV